MRLVMSLALWGCMLPSITMAQTAAPQTSVPFSLTDDRGRVVIVDKAPQRIISLLPSLGEIVCEL